MREAQRARGEKPRYDGRWRPEPGKVLPPPPAGVKPVVRFRNPHDGVVTWDDLVKGPIEHQQRRDRRPDHRRAPTARADLQLRASWSTTGTWRITPRLPRRRARQQHAAGRSTSSARWARRCRSYGHLPDHPGRRRPEAVQAPRRGQRHRSTTRTATCPRRCSTTWRAWAGATATTSSSRREQMVQWFDGRHLAKSPAQWDAGQAAPGSTRTT